MPGFLLTVYLKDRKRIMQEYVIIVAAGTGSRMKSVLPKQFLDLGGKPVVAHTIERFYNYNNNIGIILVLNQDYVQFWKDLCRTIDFTIPHEVIAGGAERFDSVKKGLSEIKNIDAVVGIHDAVRPLVSAQTLISCYHTAREMGSAVPVVSVHDTLRQVDGGTSKTVNRDQFRIVQTPQCFRIDILREAYLQPFNNSFTDDASVVESAGNNIVLVEGNKSNIKITTPEDLALAKSLLSN